MLISTRLGLICRVAGRIHYFNHLEILILKQAQSCDNDAVYLSVAEIF